MSDTLKQLLKDRFLIWVVLSSLFISVGYTHLGLSTNDASRYSLTKAIVTRGTLEIGDTLKLFEAQSGSADKTLYKGKMYSDKAPLGSFLGVVPAYLAHKAFGDDQEYWRIFVTSLFVPISRTRLTRRAPGSSVTEVYSTDASH